MAEIEDKIFLFDVEWRSGGGIAGAYLPKACTQFSNYPDSWMLYSGTITASTIANAFTAGTGSPPKAGRILDLDLAYDANGQLELSVIFVPNYGQAARKWWWSGKTGYTTEELSEVLGGGAAKAFTADGIPKALVAIERGKDGKFRFVLNEAKPGEAWWWGAGHSVSSIKDILDGKKWGAEQKRLVSLKRHVDGSWTFIAVPRAGLGWRWFTDTTFPDLAQAASDFNMRVIDLEQLGDSQDRFSAVLVQNL